MRNTLKAACLAGILAATVAGASFAFWPQSDEAEADALQQQWLAAETTANPAQAALKWEALVKALNGTEVDSGLGNAQAQQQLFTAQLKAKLWDKAEATIADWQGRQSAWGHLLLARALVQEDATKAWKHVSIAAKAAESVKENKPRSYTLHGVLVTALMQVNGKPAFRWEGPQLAEKLLSQITTPTHRAEIMHLLAMVTPAPEDVFQAALHEALRMPLDPAKARNERLLALYREAKANDLFFPALDALSAIEDLKMGEKEMAEWASQLFKNKEYSRTLSIAERLSDEKRGAVIWAKLAKYYGHDGQKARAKAAAERSLAAANGAHYPDDRADALHEVAEYLAEAGERGLAIKAAESIAPEFALVRDDALGGLIKSLAEDNQLEDAQRLLKGYAPKSKKLKSVTYAAVIKALAEEGQKQAAQDLLDDAGSLADTPQYQKALKAIEEADEDEGEETKKKKEKPEASAEPIEDITNIARTLMNQPADARARALKFRALAERQARQTDYYGYLSHRERSANASEQGEGKKADAPSPGSQARRPLPLGEVIAKLDSSAAAALEKALAERTQSGEKVLDLREPVASPLGIKIPAVPAQDAKMMKYTAAKLRAELPLGEGFILRRIYYDNNILINKKFKVAIGHAPINTEQKIVTPEVVYLERGTATLPQIYDALRAQGKDSYLLRDGTDYTLRRALLVGREARLIIDGSEVSTLYQSGQYGGILVNGGNLHITNTKLVAWDEEKKKPLFATYDDRYSFRPFIASWSGSHTYMGGNEVVALGYNNHKSYGISLSAGPKKMEVNSLYPPSRPDGIIADNSFENVYYGFYSYEADYVGLIGNEYNKNIIYGIDPHDRSRWLTIAYNTAYGSYKKHGIIVSREVTDSSYIGNLSFDNHGSGMMIDRLSHGTYVYGNTAFGNGQDGLTLFESSCNLIASNHFFANKSMGVRVRNSQNNGLFYNYFDHNNQGAVYGYISNLKADPAHIRRNFTLDPFADVTAMTMVGNRIEANKGGGVLADDMTALLLRGNNFVEQSPRVFQGAWFRDHPYLANQYDLEKKGALITTVCPRGEWINYRCRWRDQGVYAGDGQDGLADRVKASPCHGEPITPNPTFQEVAS